MPLISIGMATCHKEKSTMYFRHINRIAAQTPMYGQTVVGYYPIKVDGVHVRVTVTRATRFTFLAACTIDGMVHSASSQQASEAVLVLQARLNNKR